MSLTIEAVRAGDVVTLHGLKEPVSYHVEHVAGPCWILRPSGEGAAASTLHVAHVARAKGAAWVHVDGRTHVIERVASRRGTSAEGDGSLIAPMTGKIIEVGAGVSVGQAVEEGSLVVALSAMKMRVELKAPFAGVVAKLAAKEGEQVEGGTLLALIERVVKRS